MTKYVEDRVREELLSDGNLLVNTVMEINNYNGMLGDLNVSHMSELDEFFQGMKVSKILSMAQKGNFNIDDDYFIYNGYSNLKSFSKESFVNECKGFYFDEIIEQIDNINLRYLPNELKQIIEDAEIEERYEEEENE